MSEALHKIGSAASERAPRGAGRGTPIAAGVAAGLALGVHIPALAAAFRGETIPGAPLDDGDTLYSLRLAGDAWAWLLEARSIGDVLAVPVQARVLNGLDLVVAVWPARALAGIIGTAPALAALHVGLVMAAAAAGAVYARALGAGVAGATAGGVLAGASGMVLTVVGIGQYPQGLLVFPLVWFAGLARTWRGERGGVPLAIAGGAGSLLAYWLFAPILALGTLVFGIAAWTVSWAVAPRVGRSVVGIGGGVVAIVLPWALPVWSAADTKVASVPWGTGFHAAAYWRDAAAHVVGEVPLTTLFSLGGGWLPALPLLVAVVLGVRRATVPWLALALAGAWMALGPLPMVPGVGAPIAGLREAVPEIPRWMDPAVLSEAERVENVPYQVVYQWLPGASRMRHPIRWGVLVVAGLVPLVAFGVDRIAARRRSVGWGVVAAGGAWVALVGPWPLPSSPFPGTVAEVLGACSEVLFPALPQGNGGRLERMTRLDAIHGRPRYPRREDVRGGVGALPPGLAKVTADREALLARVATGDLTGLPEGACLVLDPAFTVEIDRVALAIDATLGEPANVVFPEHTVDPEGRAGELRVWRVRR